MTKANVAKYAILFEVACWETKLAILQRHDKVSSQYDKADFIMFSQLIVLRKYAFTNGKRFIKPF